MADVKSIFELIIGVLGVAGNLLVCISIIRAKFMHNITNYILLSLSIADFFVCLSIIIFNKYVLHVGIWAVDFKPSSDLIGEIICQLFDDKLLVWLSSKTSVMHLVFVAIERYIAIVQPLHYKRYFTIPRLFVLFISLWIISLLWQLPYMLTPGYNTETLQCDKPKRSAFSNVFFICTNSLFIIIPSICTLWCYWKILKCLRSSAETFLKNNNRGPALELLVACRKVVQTFLIVYVAFIILWFPNLILGITYILANIAAPPEVSTAFRLMAFANSVVNPFIYGFKYRQLRKAFKLTVMPCCCNPQVDPSNVASTPIELTALPRATNNFIP